MSDIKKDLQNVYNSVAAEFSNTRYMPWEELSVFIPYLPPKSKILDLGCGNGRLIKVLDESGKKYDYLGIDFSKNLLDQARQQFPKHNFQLADMMKISFPENSFDAICLVASFHHLNTKKERQELLDKIHGWLKPGGVLFITNWNLWQPKYRKYFFKNFFQKKSVNDFFIPYKLSNKKEIYWRYYHHFTNNELKKILQKSGFQISAESIYRTKYNLNCLVKK